MALGLYNPYDWVNGTSAVNETNLDHIEQGIYNVSLNSVTTCELTYQADTLSLKIKNTAGTELASYSVTIPSGESITALGFDTSDNHCILRYKTNSNSSWTNVLDLSTIFYTKTDIDGCFSEVTVDPD